MEKLYTLGVSKSISLLISGANFGLMWRLLRPLGPWPMGTLNIYEVNRRDHDGIIDVSFLGKIVTVSRNDQATFSLHFYIHQVAKHTSICSFVVKLVD